MSRKTDHRKIIKRTADGKRTDRVKKAERERMLRLRNQDKTIEEIALELDRSERTVSKQLQKAQAGKKQEDGSTQTSQKEVDPLIAKAQEEHLAEICGLIEKWKDAVRTPQIDEVSLNTLLPTYDIEANPLFQYLREHLPNRNLWDNYSCWASKLNEYLFKCKRLIKEILEEDQIWEDALSPLAGFERPILKRISDKAMGKMPKPHRCRRDFLEEIQAADEEGNPIFPEMVRISFVEIYDTPDTESSTPVSREETHNIEDGRIYMLYVDDTPVVETVNTYHSENIYKKISYHYLHSETATDLITLFNELKDLEFKINKAVELMLLSRKHLMTTCAICLR